MRLHPCTGTLLALGLVTGGFYPYAAGAQDNADTQTAPAEVIEVEPARVIPQILTTARRREQVVQDVPVAVSAFDETFIEAALLNDISEFDRFTPNVNLGPLPFTGNGLTASIRGVSFADLEKTFEPAIGLSVDGVFLGSNAGAAIDAFDLQSIEILRGPQGTLFGRNTIGGTINVRRTRPTGEFGVKLGFRVGSNNKNDYRAMVNLPLVKDILAAKVTAYVNKDDAFTVNVNTGKNDPGQDVTSISGAFLLTPSDNFEALLTIDYYDEDSNFAAPLNLTEANGLPFGMGGTLCDASQQFFGIPIPGSNISSPLDGCAALSFDLAEASNFKNSFNDPNNPVKSFLELIAVTLEMEWDLGEYTITSISGYRDQDERLEEDNLGAPVPAFQVLRVQQYEQFSQEVRLTSDLKGPFNFVAGAYYFRAEYDLDPASATIFGFIPAQLFSAHQVAEAYAIFADGTYDITDDLTLSAGLRYTWERKSFDTDHVLGEAAPFVTDARASWDKPTWRLSLDYQITDDVMTYVSYNRGFRSGGFNGRATTPLTATTPYDPETVDSVEIGLRSDWFNNRLRFNLTGFYAEYKDQQVEIIRASGQATETLVENAAKSTHKGVELEIVAIPFENLTLRSAIGYLDAEYNEFFSTDPMGNEIDVSDVARVRRAPDWTVSIGADYYIPLGNGGEIVLNTLFYWVDEYTTTPFINPARPTIGVIDDYATVDFSVSYNGPLGNTGGDYRITAFVKDAFHKNARLSTAIDAGIFVFGFAAQGRTWGLELTADF